jgi:hypothetical protein
MSSGSLPPDMILPELSRSWLRSWNAGLLPCGRSPGVPHASAAQLARALEHQRELVGVLSVFEQNLKSPAKNHVISIT